MYLASGNLFATLNLFPMYSFLLVWIPSLKIMERSGSILLVCLAGYRILCKWYQYHQTISSFLHFFSSFRNHLAVAIGEFYEIKHPSHWNILVNSGCLPYNASIAIDMVKHREWQRYIRGACWEQLNARKHWS